MRPRLLSRGKVTAFANRYGLVVTASMRPRLLSRGKRRRAREALDALKASMRPRLLSRGKTGVISTAASTASRFNEAATVKSRKDTFSGDDVCFVRCASMRPRLLSRGKRAETPRLGCYQDGFNEAATVKSRKEGSQRRPPSAKCASMRPRLLSRGKAVGMRGKPSNNKLQ